MDPYQSVLKATPNRLWTSLAPVCTLVGSDAIPGLTHYPKYPTERSRRLLRQVRAQVHCAGLLDLQTRRWTVAQGQCFNAQCLRGVVGRRNDHDGDKRACRNTAETMDMSMIAVIGTSTSKRLSVALTESIWSYPSAGSQASSHQPQTLNFRTILLEVDVPACPLRGTILSSTAEAKLSDPPSSCQNGATSSEPSCQVSSKVPKAPASSSVDKALPCPQVHDAVSPAPSQGHLHRGRLEIINNLTSYTACGFDPSDF